MFEHFFWRRRSPDKAVDFPNSGKTQNGGGLLKPTTNREPVMSLAETGPLPAPDREDCTSPPADVPFTCVCS